VKAIPEGPDDFSGIVEVGSREGVVDVERIPGVRDVKNRQSHSPAFADVSSELDIANRVGGEVAWTIGLQDSGAMNDISGYKGMPGQTGFQAGAECISLIVIQVAEGDQTSFRHGVDQSAGRHSFVLRDHIRERQVKADPAQQFGRFNRQFFAVNPGVRKALREAA
jgi:hypothetical protein